MNVDREFETFVQRARPRLARALASCLARDDVGDAVNEAVAYAWEHRNEVLAMDHPIAFLFRVGQSKSRQRREGFLPWQGHDRLPHIEPGLVPALVDLPARQATVVWLVHGCGWTHPEVGEALGITPSTVATHAHRALRAIRSQMGVHIDG